MSLRRVTEKHPFGGVYIEKNVMDVVTINASMTLDFSKVDKGRKRKVVTALERGFSRGNSSSEQYLLYSTLCQHFGMRPARITSGRYNLIPVPHGEDTEAFKKKLKHHLIPAFQLVGKEPPRDERQYREDYWWGMHAQNDVGGRSVGLHKPSQIPMHVFAKLLKDFLPVKDPAKINAAVLFVNNGDSLHYPMGQTHG